MNSRSKLGGAALAVLATAGVGGAAAKYATRRDHRIIGRPEFASVLVNRPLDQLQPRPGVLAEPLDRLSSVADLELSPGPAGRGTVVRAHRVTGDEQTDLRPELRRAKQILETGEELVAYAWPADRDPAAQRRTKKMDTLLGKGGGR
jgi:hypothetical protein